MELSVGYMDLGINQIVQLLSVRTDLTLMTNSPLLFLFSCPLSGKGRGGKGKTSHLPGRDF